MKERSEIVFMVRGESNSIKRISFPLPLWTRESALLFPKDCKLYEIILKGAKRCQKLTVSGKPELGDEAKIIETEISSWVEIQTITLNQPLADDISIVFEVTDGVDKGLDITNSPTMRQKKPAKNERGARPMTYVEFAVHLDAED